jgi:hypothetical protein
MAFDINKYIPTPQNREAFSKLVPYESLFSPGLISGLATQQVAPEVLRQRRTASRDLGRSLTGSGGWRTGAGQVARRDLGDQYTRMQREQEQNFGSQISDWLGDWYNKQAYNYGTNPSAPVIDQMKGQASQMMQAFNPNSIAGMYGGNTSNKSPFLY